MSRPWVIAIAATVTALFLVTAVGMMRALAGVVPIDTDGDGCSDAEEAQYGMDPKSPYDFYDVPPRDGTVDLVNDVFGVALKFGYDATNPNYWTSFDRSNNGGELGPPDGTIDLVTDIFGAALQFGRVCHESEWCSGNIQEYPGIAEEKSVTGYAKMTTCFAVRDDGGAVVDYVIVDDEEQYVVHAEEPGLPPDFLLGAPAETGISSSGGPSVLYFSL